MRKVTNFYQEDPHFQKIVEQYIDQQVMDWAKAELDEFGELCANEIDERAVHTDREGQPQLIKYNKLGEDISEIWVNDGYRKTVEQTYNTGIVGYVHKEIPALGVKGNYAYSFAQGYLLSQAEPGFYCPVTLTMATAYLLDHYASDEVKARFLPHVLSTGETELYEGATFLTERQGGSDVGANETKAVKVGNHYKLYGEKYFASNSGMCGVTMVLARIDEQKTGSKGLSLFAVPWRNEDGSLNGIQIRRLKDKLGVRAVPSAEVEFDGAMGYLVGDASRGFYYMMEALNLSRVCNAVASIGIMRRAYLEARNYAHYREAFGSRLTDYPMVKDTLTRLAVKQEVSVSAVFALISLFDKVMSKEQPASEKEIVLNRLLIALVKKETAEQAIHFSHEAIEMHGGNGFIEDFVTPRLLRDAQVLTVWEGTANILGLEILRLMKKFNAHTLFVSEMEKELAEVDGLLELKAPVAAGLEALQELTDGVLNAGDDVQTFHSKKIAVLMTKIYESVIALKGAANGKDRDRAVAEIFIQECWNSEWHDQEMKTVRYFDVIVGSQLVEREKVEL